MTHAATDQPLGTLETVATDGYLYVTANQLHRQAAYQGGKDLRERPYHVFRTPIDAGPVLLRPAS
ncbi:MAG: hypothetical protein ACRDRA_08825 [Pseudonocardiaceae bacterium]